MIDGEEGGQENDEGIDEKEGDGQMYGQVSG